eukprot:UN14458
MSRRRSLFMFCMVRKKSRFFIIFDNRDLILEVDSLHRPKTIVEHKLPDEFKGADYMFIYSEYEVWGIVKDNVLP